LKKEAEAFCPIEAVSPETSFIEGEDVFAIQLPRSQNQGGFGEVHRSVSIAGHQEYMARDIVKDKKALRLW
jgi:hypothetical protein